MVVGTGGPQHGLILGGGGLGELRAESHELPGGVTGKRGHHVSHHLFIEGRELLAFLIRQPGLHLRDAFGILQPGQSHGFGGKLLLVALIHSHGELGHPAVNTDAPFVDPGVQAPETALLGRRHPVLQGVEDGALDLHVPLAVGFEGVPFLRGMLREVPGPPIVGLGRLAGLAEIADQGLTFPHLGLVLREP